MTHRQGSSAAAEINGAEDDVKALRKQLTRLTLERDELQRDVENLCMQGSGNSIFDSSSVLSERIYSTEQELSRAKAQLAGLVSERDGLREDLHSQREAKRMSDQGWKSERQKVQNLEKELAFYQSQSTRAIQDRDKAVYEAEELKALSREQQRRLLVAETTAEQESTLRAEMQEELEEATQRVKELEGCEEEAAAIPALRQDLRTATARVDSLQQQVKSLQDELHESQAETATAWQKLGSLSERAAATEKELNSTQAAASEAEAASSKQIQQLKATVDALQQEQENLEGQVRDAHRKLAEANTELRTVRQEFKHQLEEQQAQFRAVEEETYNEREQQVLLFQKKQDEMQSRINAVEKQLQEVSQDKVKALLRLSELERVQAHDGSEIDALRRQKSDLQVRLAQATQEKVNVLMQLAEARGQAGDPRPPSSNVSPKQQASGSWRACRCLGTAAAMAGQMYASDSSSPKTMLVKPQDQQMAQQLVATSSNLPSPGAGPAPGVSVGTQLLAPLNTVHVKYRGFFKDDYKSCCSKPLREYMVKPCVRGFGELPPDNEFDAGELSLAVDDYNPGCASFMCFPCCYNRLTLTCKDKFNGLSFVMERPCAAPCFWLPCWPLTCCISCPLKVFVRNTEGTVVGYAEQTHKCCSCSSWIKVYDAAGTLIYTLTMSCCQNCCTTFCLPNCMCKHKRLAIHPAGGADTVGEVIQTYPGCCRSMFTNANDFFVAFPPAAPADHKAVLMAASFLANYLYF